MDATTIGGYVAFVTPVALAVYAACNHKHVRSRCCGREIEMSFDVESTLPNPVKIAPAPAPEVVVVHTGDDPLETSPVNNGSVSSYRTNTPPSTPKATPLPPFSPKNQPRKISPIAGSYRKPSR